MTTNIKENDTLDYHQAAARLLRELEEGMRSAETEGCLSEEEVRACFHRRANIIPTKTRCSHAA